MAKDLPVLELEGCPEVVAWSGETDDLEYRRRVCCRVDWKRWIADPQALASRHRPAFARSLGASLSQIKCNQEH